MEIQHINDPKKGYFEALEDGKQAGQMTYTWAGDSQFIIDHTEVSDDFAGKGVGKKLLMATVDFARKNKVKIIPLCPFAKSVFDKVEDIRDVLS
ncbi:GNAT family acetyltransferase [Flavobacterium sp. Root901]|uniref:GNAT family N-acetyltransferase n=1 Tax=Flavobacterium sp. Root901 TaxID=1736605 RepID=UPI00070A8812|nr:GNAT family N-acetyltransferase [Flavobacterium sp. Root901]KRD10134.1 GNAT family acetyltransferase [Flavobacterium sp. Root901]